MIIILDKSHARSLAKIHHLSLTGDFLPSLGENFLKLLYQSNLGKKGIYALGYKDKGKLVGMVIGSSSMRLFFVNTLKNSLAPLITTLFWQVIKRPRLIVKIFETFLYPKKEFGSKAELVVITVLKKYQGRGVGKKLIEKLEELFKKDGIKKYKLTVHQDKKAVGFYQHLDYKKIGSFSLYGKGWYVYEKKI